MIEIGASSRAMLGESCNGDNILIHEEKNYTVVSVIDGIGHGKIANVISLEIRRYMNKILCNDPEKMLIEIHDHMMGYEGATVGIGVLEKNLYTYASIGNISCFLKGEKSKIFISSEGLVGVRRRSIKKETIRLSNGDMVVMHSDGISSRSLMKKQLNHHLFSAKGLARKIIKDHGSSYDDASVVVIQIGK